MAITKSDAIRVWTVAGAMCSFTGCRKDLLRDESTTLQGEIAHIIASSMNGPRGRVPLSEAERDDPSNLLLLCPNHHAEIDGDPAAWTTETLIDMKQEHETWVARQRRLGEDTTASFGSPYLMNVRRVLLDPAARGIREDLDDLDLRQVDRLSSLTFGVSLRLVTAVEDLLSRWEARAVDVTRADIDESAVGARVKLINRFYTKNCPYPGHEVPMTGDLTRDPHLWSHVGHRRAYIPLDPRWFTSNSSYTWFTAGNARFAVLGNLMDVSDERLLISPLVVAIPTPEW